MEPMTTPRREMLCLHGPETCRYKEAEPPIFLSVFQRREFASMVNHKINLFSHYLEPCDPTTKRLCMRCCQGFRKIKILVRVIIIFTITNDSTKERLQQNISLREGPPLATPDA